MKIVIRRSNHSLSLEPRCASSPFHSSCTCQGTSINSLFYSSSCCFRCSTLLFLFLLLSGFCPHHFSCVLSSPVPSVQARLLFLLHPTVFLVCCPLLSSSSSSSSSLTRFDGFPSTFCFSGEFIDNVKSDSIRGPSSSRPYRITAFNF
jgi:hypothetical protein